MHSRGQFADIPTWELVKMHDAEFWPHKKDTSGFRYVMRTQV